MKWDEYKQRVEAGKFTADEKTVVLQGIDYLQSYLGKDWPEPVWLWYQREVEKVEKEFPRWALFRLARLGEALWSLRNAQRFRALCQRLQDKTKYDGAELELEVGDRLKNLNLGLELYSPVGNGQVDAKLCLSKPALYFEVSKLYSSKAEAEGWKKLATTGSVSDNLHLIDSTRRVLDRTRRKVNEENKQLPVDCPGIIVLSSFRFIAIGDSSSVLNFGNQLKTTVQRHLDLAFVVLSWHVPQKGYQLGPLNEQEGHVHYFRRYCDDLEWETLVVENDRCKFSLGQLKNKLIEVLAEP